MKLKIKRLSPEAKLPFYASGGAAAMDLCACINAPLALEANQRALVTTGIAIELPPATCALVLARSGLSMKHGIALANGVGLIDCDYRGEILVALVNIGDTAYIINPGERIAQLSVLNFAHTEIVEAEELSDTARGEGGFGSTGK